MEKNENQNVCYNKYVILKNQSSIEIKNMLKKRL